jgi:carboxypeptidase family protein
MMAKLSSGRLAALVLAMGAGMAAQQLRNPAAQEADWTIAGTMISAADGQPLSRAEVSLASTTDRAIGQGALTGNDGRFRFPGLPPGKYVLQAQHRGFVSQIYQQHGAFSTAIAVGPGLLPPDVLFRLQPEAIISGKVVDEAGDAVREARVMLLHKSLLNGQWGTRMENSAQTDDQGFYHFGHLLPGRYFVAIQTEPWYARPPMRWIGRTSVAKLSTTTADRSLDVVYPITYYQDATDPDDAAPIDLQPGEDATADINLAAVPAQHIKIHMAEDAVVQGFNARFSQQLSDKTAISVSANFQKIAPGVYESTGVPPGNYEVQMFYAPKPGQEGGVKQAKTVQVGKDEEIDLTEPSASASVSGTVRFVPASKAPEHLSIMLVGAHSQEAFRTPISPRGDFAFNHALPPGEYQVVSRSVEGLFIASLSATGAAVAGRTLRITSPDPVVLRVVMSRGVAQVKGTAVRDGKAVSGALVVLVPSDPGNNLVLFRADQSDSDGTFTLPVVVPGKYTVVAIDNGWGLEWQNPAVLKPYLPHGQALEIAPEGRYNIKPEVQDF